VQEDESGLIEDAERHRPGMEVDTAIESVLGLVEPHHGPPCGKWVSSSESTDRGGRRLGEAMMNIKSLQRTRPAAAHSGQSKATLGGPVR
jgi:hypothetical protein